MRHQSSISLLFSSVNEKTIGKRHWGAEHLEIIPYETIQRVIEIRKDGTAVTIASQI